MLELNNIFSLLSFITFVSPMSAVMKSTSNYEKKKVNVTCVRASTQVNPTDYSGIFLDCVIFSHLKLYREKKSSKHENISYWPNQSIRQKIICKLIVRLWFWIILALDLMWASFQFVFSPFLYKCVIFSFMFQQIIINSICTCTMQSS